MCGKFDNVHDNSLVHAFSSKTLNLFGMNKERSEILQKERFAIFTLSESEYQDKPELNYRNNYFASFVDIP